MTTRTLGERIGVEQVTLGVDQLPLHDHFVVPEPSTWLLASSACWFSACAWAGGACFSSDGSQLASVGEEVKIWDAEQGTQLRTLLGSSKALFASARTAGAWPRGGDLNTCAPPPGSTLSATRHWLARDGHRGSALSGWPAIPAPKRPRVQPSALLLE